LSTLGSCPLDTEVFLDLLELVHRDVELIAILVGEQKEIALDAADVEVHEFPVNTDPVIHVDDEIALVQVLERTQENPRNGLARASSNASRRFPLRDYRKPFSRPKKAVLKIGGHDFHGSRIEGFLTEGTQAQRSVYPVVFQQFGDPRGPVLLGTDQKYRGPS